MKIAQKSYGDLMVKSHVKNKLNCLNYDKSFYEKNYSKHAGWIAVYTIENRQNRGVTAN